MSQILHCIVDFFCSYVCQKYIVRRNSINDKRESTEELQCTVTEGTKLFAALSYSTFPKNTMFIWTTFENLTRNLCTKMILSKRACQTMETLEYQIIQTAATN